MKHLSLHIGAALLLAGSALHAMEGAPPALCGPKMPMKKISGSWYNDKGTFAANIEATIANGAVGKIGTALARVERRLEAATDPGTPWTSDPSNVTFLEQMRTKLQAALEELQRPTEELQPVPELEEEETQTAVTEAEIRSKLAQIAAGAAAKATATQTKESGLKQPTEIPAKPVKIDPSKLTIDIPSTNPQDMTPEEIEATRQKKVKELEDKLATAQEEARLLKEHMTKKETERRENTQRSAQHPAEVKGCGKEVAASAKALSSAEEAVRAAQAVLSAKQQQLAQAEQQHALNEGHASYLNEVPETVKAHDEHVYDVQKADALLLEEAEAKIAELEQGLATLKPKEDQPKSSGWWPFG